MKKGLAIVLAAGLWLLSVNADAGIVGTYYTNHLKIKVLEIDCQPGPLSNLIIELTNENIEALRRIKLYVILHRPCCQVDYKVINWTLPQPLAPFRSVVKAIPVEQNCDDFSHVEFRGGLVLP